MTTLSFDEAFSRQIQRIETLPAREADFADLPESLHPRLASSLTKFGIERLYSHQAQAFALATNGRDLAVVTGTNSGKSLCYNLPVLQALHTEPNAKAIYLFPTKALAQDQAAKLKKLADPFVVATYDGDTPKAARSKIRSSAQIILTNPDMLHSGILPSHENWTKFFRSLRYIVLDESHVYRGIFGSHVANILWRLLRLCEAAKSRPQIIACSATIGNPVDHFRSLTRREPELIDDDGSPSGRKTLVFWRPPIVADAPAASVNIAASEMLATLAQNGVRSLLFNRTRISAELVLRYARERLAKRSPELVDKIDSYRGGYTPKERRAIEQALFKGELLGLSSTSAMELGVDVGDLDAVVLNGYPGTSASFWQQCGRSGRGARDGLAIFLAHPEPLEHYLAGNPEAILEGKGESAALDPLNPFVFADQLRCAAYERPVSASELADLGEGALHIAERMDLAGDLTLVAGAFAPASAEPPGFEVNIRGASRGQVRLEVEGVELGTLDEGRAKVFAHPGAIYLHRGQTFLCESLDLDLGIARLSACSADYTTQAIVTSDTEAVRILGELDLGKMVARLADLEITRTVDGYRTVSSDGLKSPGAIPLELPSDTFPSRGIVLNLTSIEEEDETALHGAEHLLAATAPLFASVDRRDLGSLWRANGRPNVPGAVIYDAVPGGVGTAERLFEMFDAWLRASLRLIKTCPCEHGCPGCLLVPECSVGNEPLNKQATTKLLERLV